MYPATQRVKAEQNVNKSTFVLEDVRACVCVPVRAHTHTHVQWGIRSFYNQKWGKTLKLHCAEEVGTIVDDTPSLPAASTLCIGPAF